MASEKTLRADLQVAMKARDMATVYVLRGVLAAIANQKIERGVAELPPPEVVAIIQREVKQRDEAEAFARAAGREDLVTKNASERTLLARYLPPQLGDAELTNLVRDWLAEGLHGIGPIMARLKERHAGRYDGKHASELVRSILADKA